MTIAQLFLQNVIKRFNAVKTQGERSLTQIQKDSDFLITFSQTDVNEEYNSIAVIIHHLAGNMKSRWTNFLSEDGEKPNRNRPSEFDKSFKLTKEKLIKLWESGWEYLFNTLDSLNDEDLNLTVQIRKEEHSVIDAILRQLAHYANHVGQLTLLTKLILQDNWKNISIPSSKEVFDYRNLSLQSK